MVRRFHESRRAPHHRADADVLSTSSTTCVWIPSRRPGITRFTRRPPSGSSASCSGAEWVYHRPARRRYGGDDCPIAVCRPVLFTSAVVATVLALLAFVIYAAVGLEARLSAHRAFVHRLWIVLERYRSLLAEVEEGIVDGPALLRRRDELIHDLHAIYEFGFGLGSARPRERPAAGTAGSARGLKRYPLTAAISALM